MNTIKYDRYYIDMDYIIDERPEPFCFIVGGRGIGKSYGCGKNMIKTGKKFVYIRMTDKELKMCASEAGNPFKKLNKDLGTDYHFKKLDDYTFGIYNGDSNLYSGIAIALTTFSKVRGVDFSDCTHIVLDEFIPEKIVKKISGIGEALFQAYETINRNRELEGEKPVKLIAMANALNINNEILIDFQLVTLLQKMKTTHDEWKSERNIFLVCPWKTPISDLKKNTALYQINQRFNDMALDNQFREYYEGNIQSCNIKTKKLICTFDRLSFYKDSNTSMYYVSPFRANGSNAPIYKNTDFESRQFCLTYHYFTGLYYMNKFRFENAETELHFINLFDIK